MKTCTFAAMATFIALFATAPTSIEAMTVADLNPANARVASPASKMDFLFGDQMIPGRVERLDRVDAEAASAAAQAYFDFDAIVSVGALVLAGAAFVAVGVGASRRRKIERDPPPAAGGAAWRTLVLDALERDINRFVRGLRRAA